MLNWLKRLFSGKKDNSANSQSLQGKYQTLPPKKEAKTLNIESDSNHKQPGRITADSIKPQGYDTKKEPIGKREQSFNHSKSAPTRQQAPAPPTAIWVPPGKSVKLGDYVIPGGMLYIGTQLQGNGTYTDIDPCLINPKLRVNKAKPDYEGDGMGYWPSYHKINPACRAAYLEWLASGRSDPNANIGYIFLFFYGLERRILKDLMPKRDKSKEIIQIKNEVERLLRIYKNNNSFNGYASQFLDICRIIGPTADFCDFQPPLERTVCEVPTSIKIGLGQMVKLGQPIPVHWLFSWYIHSEQTRLRTPATRCAEEFRKLLKIKYHQTYGEGMVLTANKRRLQVNYRPASSGFIENNIYLQIEDLPDVTAQTAPLHKFQSLVDECTDALDPYSRWLGRNSENPDPKTGLALLPQELVEDFEDGTILNLRQWLTQILGDSQTINIAADDLLHYWSATPDEKLTKKESITLAQGLEKLRYGIEPDVRFGGKPVQKDGRVTIFKLGPENISKPSKEYLSATLLLHLAVTVAKADDSSDIAESQYLKEHLEVSLQLSEPERIRLRAHLAWLLQENLNLRGLKNKLNSFPDDKKMEIANFLISVAGADGHISPKEISTLSKIYPLLSLQPNDVYSHIHNFNVCPKMTPAMAPVTVKQASTQKSGFTIPAPPQIGEEASAKEVDIDAEKDSSGFMLDPDVIIKKQKESAEIAAHLGIIFEEEEQQDLSSELQIGSIEAESSTSSLDSMHYQFLKAIAQKENWNRDDLETTASHLGLMLDGALEAINDAAFELCDEALTDGEDPIEIDAEVLSQLLS